MKVIIVEDEALAAERLQKLIHRVDPSIEIIATISSVEEGVSWIRDNPAPDLAFFDIELSDGSSFDLANTVKVNFPVIFTTSYDQYALEAFSLKSVDYLLKPIRFQRLEQAIQKFRSWQQPPLSDIQADLTSIIQEAMATPSSDYKERWLVKNGNLIQAVPTSDIAYFYSDQKTSLLMTKQGKRFPLDQSLDKVMGLLDPRVYFRLNRKYIIHIDAPAKMHPYFKGRLKVELSPPIDDDIVVSSERTPAFKAWLDR